MRPQRIPPARGGPSHQEPAQTAAGAKRPRVDGTPRSLGGAGAPFTPSDPNGPAVAAAEIPEPAEESPMRDEPADRPEEQERRVLIVDDDPEFAEGIADILEAHGYTVAVAHSAEQARSVIQDFDAWVALVDIRLGTDSGLDLIADLKEARPGIFCVMISGYTEVESAIRALREGVHEYLRKPQAGRDLLAAIERCFEVAQLRREKGAVEDERKQALAQLARSNEELERFAYTASHDLKAPLITITGFLGMLAQDAEKGNAERVKSDIARISDAARKMGRLLDDLLELSRIGRMGGNCEEVPLGELACEAVELLNGQIEEREVPIEIGPDLPVVRGERSRLVELLMNLIGNAVKFMGDQAEPRVEVGARRDQDETVCYVRDNGIGIDRRHKDRIFGLFQQLDREADGTGTGLAIAKRVVETQGGRIWIESEGPGKGSTFCFTLPEKGQPVGEEVQ